MTRTVDLTGRRFGRLTVLRPASEAERRGTVSRDSQWRCRCDCGREVTQTAGRLKQGRAVTCGCGPRSGRRLDLAGRRFGLLTVEGRAAAPEGYSRWYALWRCRCDCGGSAVIPTAPLTSGAVGSCGCRGDGPRRRGRPPADLAGLTFGALTAVRPTGRADSRGSRLWLCRCVCGAELEACARALRHGQNPCRHRNPAVTVNGRAQPQPRGGAAGCREAGLTA